ncbi:MAG TPA: hypothetical protein VLA76_00390 [Candidatus Angelobacter sp.]|nr:hypothetical protein [Candidatus Angelobacter sp.]
MSIDPETTRIVRTWLDEGVTQLPDRVLDGVLDELVATPQVRARPRLPRSIGLLIAATILLAVLGGALTLGTRIGEANRHPTPTQSAAPSVRSLMPLPSGPMEAGPYSVDAAFPVHIGFEIPEGWSKVLSDPDLIVIERRTAGLAVGPGGGIQLGFSMVENLFADPCALEEPMLEPPIGPSVDDLAEAFARIPAYEASTPVPVSVDGHPGLSMELDLLLFMCPFGEAGLWRTPAGSIRVAAGEEEQLTLWILDVGGERIVVTASTFPETTADDIAALDAAFDTIDLAARGD